MTSEKLYSCHVSKHSFTTYLLIYLLLCNNFGKVVHTLMLLSAISILYRCKKLRRWRQVMGEVWCTVRNTERKFIAGSRPWNADESRSHSHDVLLWMSDEPTYFSVCRACKMLAACDLKYRGVCSRLNKTL